MLPWMEKRQQQDLVLDSGSWSEPEKEEDSGLIKLALRGLASQFRHHLEMGDDEGLAECFHQLCELCISAYDRD